MPNSAVTNTPYGGNWCVSNWASTNWCSWYNICQIPVQVTFLTNGVANTSFQMNWVFYNLTNLRKRIFWFWMDVICHNFFDYYWRRCCFHFYSNILF